MFRRIALLSLLALLPFLTVAPTGVHGASRDRVDIVSSGIELSLSVPARVYPRNALVQVTVTVKNVSRHVIHLGGICPDGPIQVQVMNRAGQVVYPPAVPVFAQPSCPPPPTASGPGISAGRGMEAKMFVVLRARDLWATVLLGRYNTEVTTPILHLRLVSGQAPRAALHTSPRVYADIRPVDQVTGPLIYTSSYRCGGYSVNSLNNWQETRNSRLSPSCSPVSEWYALAGWLNQPAVSITYKK